MFSNTTRRGAMGIALATLLAMSLPAVAVADGNGAVIVGDGESIQAAIDAAAPGTTIHVRGDHVEQVWINKNGIKLLGEGATLSMPEDREPNPCQGFNPETNETFDTLICVANPALTFEDPFDPFDPVNRLSGITVSGFTASNPFFDTIGTYLVDGLTIERNTITGSGCDGIWVLFARDFHVERNSVSASVGCGNVDILGSTGGTVSRNTSTDGTFAGFSLDDVSDVDVSGNTATGNCIGIVVGDSPGPLPSSGVSITRNTTNANNKVCYPFGPEIPIGVAGILVPGASDVVVARNTANDNVSTEFTITNGGIVIGDFADNIGTNVLVERNTATGNSTAAGPLDINFNGVGDSITVSRNRCQFSFPNADWCQG